MSTAHGDLVADTLNFYRERTSPSTVLIDDPYSKVKKRVQQAKDSGKEVLVTINESYRVESHVLTLKYIGDKWCMGTFVGHESGNPVEVPYTIHYSDLFIKDSGVQMIVDGEKYFEQTT